PTSGNPGVLSFDQAAVSVPESDDSLEVVVRRTGGDDGAVGVSYASADGSATADEDYTPVAGTLSWPDGDDDPRSFTLPLLDDTLPEANETVQLSLSAPTGGAGLGAVSASTVTLEDDDIDFGPCVADAQTLCLGVDGRFKVEVSFRTSDGQQGNGQSVDFGRRDSGLFYFFNPNNVEMLVKVLNACNLPGFQTYWVFFAATTNVEFTLTVIDTVGGRAKQYTNPLGMAALPIQDTAAFATCP
ncbi:MAG: hypothetical protein KDD11_13955, partial [Acidobacteria bacterium]|nr:hypothetical protein [Acidobacteriota bacterium]